MKKQLLSILICGTICLAANAQTNTFPSSGNVGIGTITPSASLHIRDYSIDTDLDLLKLDVNYEGILKRRGIVWTDPSGNATGRIDTRYDGTVTKMVFGSLYNSNYTSNDILTISGNGHVGIGTTTPNSKLDLGTGYGLNGVKFLMYNDNPSSELAGTKCGFYMDNYRPNNLNLVFPEEASNPGLFTITAKNTSGTTFNPYFAVAGMTGNVGIGTNNPAYKLDVLGTIRSREVKVDMNGADFVFEKDYKLMSLNELEKYLQKEKHLPEIASAKEMETNGSELGALNSKLLQKVEELTLYVIQLNKEITALKSTSGKKNKK